MKTLLCFLALASGCATGADGARQFETVVNATIGAGYRGCKTYVQSADADAIAKAKAGKDADAQAELDQTKKVASVCLQVLDDASAAADVEDKAIVAAEAAKQKDYGAIVNAIVSIGTNIIQTLKANGVNLPGVQ